MPASTSSFQMLGSWCLSAPNMPRRCAPVIFVHRPYFLAILAKSSSSCGEMSPPGQRGIRCPLG
eukprot:6809629-Pyramimonas_sp.AAC.1